MGCYRSRLNSEYSLLNYNRAKIKARKKVLLEKNFNTKAKMNTLKTRKQPQFYKLDEFFLKCKIKHIPNLLRNTSCKLMLKNKKRLKL